LFTVGTWRPAQGAHNPTARALPFRRRLAAPVAVRVPVAEAPIPSRLLVLPAPGMAALAALTAVGKASINYGDIANGLPDIPILRFDVAQSRVKGRHRIPCCAGAVSRWVMRITRPLQPDVLRRHREHHIAPAASLGASGQHPPPADTRE